MTGVQTCALPISLAIIALPFIFAAGMSLMDALDGVFMTKAYGWAFTSPLRKIYYNLTTTSISIFVALVIGTIQIINVLASKTNIESLPGFKQIAEIDLGGIGFFIVASFVAAWLLSVAVWKIGKFEARYPSGVKETEHQHLELKLKD